MTDESELEQKFIAAFKGLINTYKLEPVHKSSHLEPKYKPSWRTFSNEKNASLELYFEVKAYHRILEIIERLFPNQTDTNLIYQVMLDALTNWITEGKDSSAQTELEIAGKKFLGEIETEIRSRRLFLPIEGLQVNSPSFVVGRCELHRHDKHSTFTQVIEQNNKRYPEASHQGESEWSEKAPAYFTLNMSGHPNRAIKNGIEEANLALNILRLYVSSYYLDENKRSVVRRMGLLGSLHSNELYRVLYINPDESIEGQYPGWKASRVIQKDFVIDHDFVEYMRNNGLDRINDLLQSMDSSLKSNDIARRLLRAITWFAKATNARSDADSYLMYAIAIEGLLSEDRTPQETYSTQMAALVTCDNNDCLIYPVGGYLSSEFAKQLKKASNLNDRFNLVRDRSFRLFSYRNRIAHGAILDNEIEDANLLDFETIVKNSILSFVKKGWVSFGEFKTWVNKSVRFDYVPTNITPSNQKEVAQEKENGRKN